MRKSCSLERVIRLSLLILIGVETCNDDLACITMASHDRLGLEAIKSLHSQLDDDADGDVDLSESDDVSSSERQLSSLSEWNIGPIGQQND